MFKTHCACLITNKKKEEEVTLQLIRADGSHESDLFYKLIHWSPTSNNPLSRGSLVLLIFCDNGEL